MSDKPKSSVDTYSLLERTISAERGKLAEAESQARISREVISKLQDIQWSMEEIPEVKTFRGR